MKDICATFAERLKARRTALGLTQREIADALGYSEKTVSKWESGVMIAPSVVLPCLAQLLHTDPNSLLLPATDHYLLGIDVGGTKTEFALADSEGKIISNVQLEGCNPVDVGFARCREILTNGIKQACADIPTSSVYAFAGIAGGTTGSNRERLGGLLAEFGFAGHSNGSDTENALATALGDEDGTVVIIGTGTVAVTRHGGELIRRGGWGYLLEEGGSGFSIGRAALMHGLALEETGECDLICRRLREAMDTDSLMSAVGKVYEGGKRGIAALAPAVLDAAEEGDGVALDIVRENMQAVARLIESTPDFDDGRKNIVITGGLVSRSDLLLPMIYDGLREPDKYLITACRERSVYGAVRLAKKLKEAGLC